MSCRAVEDSRTLCGVCSVFPLASTTSILIPLDHLPQTLDDLLLFDMSASIFFVVQPAIPIPGSPSVAISPLLDL